MAYGDVMSSLSGFMPHANNGWQNTGNLVQGGTGGWMKPPGMSDQLNWFKNSFTIGPGGELIPNPGAKTPGGTLISGIGQASQNGAAYNTNNQTGWNMNGANASMGGDPNKQFQNPALQTQGSNIPSLNSNWGAQTPYFPGR